MSESERLARDMRTILRSLTTAALVGGILLGGHTWDHRADYELWRTVCGWVVTAWLAATWWGLSRRADEYRRPA